MARENRGGFTNSAGKRALLLSGLRLAHARRAPVGRGLRIARASARCHIKFATRAPQARARWPIFTNRAR